MVSVRANTRLTDSPASSVTSRLDQQILRPPVFVPPFTADYCRLEQASNYTFYDFDWPAAEREFQRAFGLKPQLCRRT